MIRSIKKKNFFKAKKYKNLKRDKFVELGERGLKQFHQNWFVIGNKKATVDRRDMRFKRLFVPASQKVAN